MTHQFDSTVLREYDIRGIIGETLGPDDARAIGRGFATLLRRAGGSKVAVGYDGRVSSPMLEHALVEGLTASGCDVVKIGLGATPMLYYAEASSDDVDGGIQITGSHNPANYNGFKMVFQGRPFFGADIQKLGEMAASGDWDDGAGSVESREILSEYVERLLMGLGDVDRAALADLKVGWDAGNGAAGPALEMLAAKLPGEHHLLFAEVDGTFPNHHPDPTVEANLADLRALVAEKNLHFGVAFDGDGDRIGAIDGEGRVIWGDQLLMIYAEDALKAAGRDGVAVVIVPIAFTSEHAETLVELDIEYRALNVHPRDTENAIINVLRYFEAQCALVFCATRATVNHMTSRFANRGFSVVALSGELSQNERSHALQAMRDGRARVCIATDVAARGIDLPPPTPVQPSAPE